MAFMLLHMIVHSILILLHGIADSANKLASLIFLIRISHNVVYHQPAAAAGSIFSRLTSAFHNDYCVPRSNMFPAKIPLLRHSTPHDSLSLWRLFFQSPGQYRVSRTSSRIPNTTNDHILRPL
jgi:hypothetical protein